MVHSYVLQDIYDLKDQIHDVEGRYMQGLKELKVSGLFPSMHSVWVFGGNGISSEISLVPLTIYGFTNKIF